MRYLYLIVMLTSAACGEGHDLVANRAPEAFAGFDRILAQGSSVLLDGSNSSDPDGNGLSYSWRLINATDQLQLSANDSAQVTLSAEPSFRGVAIAELVVHDGAVASLADWVSINFVAAEAIPRPIANAGSNRALLLGQPLVLDAGRSTGSPDSYRWNHLHAPNRERQSINSGITALVNDLAPGLHVFGLSVAAQQSWSAMDCVSIWISEEPMNSPFPQISVESNEEDGLVLLAETDELISWSLISSPDGSSSLLSGQGDNNSRLEYRSQSTGMHLFAANQSNGLADWFAVELETTP
jgi:hypothetical protein